MKLLVKLIAILFVLSACTKLNDYKPIESDIVIEMREIIESGERSFQFYCKTTKIYNCMNWPIDRSFSLKQGQISIRFKNVIDPGICATALGPATTTIEFGNLNKGVYDLRINVADSRSLGHMIVTDDQYIIELDQQGQIGLKSSVLNRIPENTIWGTVGYHDQATETVVNEFIQTLKSAGAATASYHPGDYWYFTIGQNGQIEAPENHGYYFIRPYILNYGGNAQTLKNIVSDFGQEHHGQLNIILFTANGDIFRSWMQ